MQRDRFIDFDQAALLHRRDRSQRGIFITLLQDAPEDFIHIDRRHDQLGRILDGRREKLRVRTIGEVFQPRRRIDEVHARSVSRRMSVSMPLRKPRALRIAITGTYSTRWSYCITRTFWPGLRPSASRMRCGITTWNLGEMVTVSIRLPYRSVYRTTMIAARRR